MAKPEQLELPFEAPEAPPPPAPLMVAWLNNIPMFVYHPRYTGIITNIEPVEPPE